MRRPAAAGTGNAGERMADVTSGRYGAAVSPRSDPPVVVVVGAGPGLGRAVADRFGREGFRLVLVARRGERLRRVVGGLTRAGLSATGVEADAADPKALTGAMKEIADRHGAPQALIYNAGGGLAGRPSVLDLSTLEDAFAVNVTGLVAATQAVLPAMREHGRGTIIATGSGIALDPRPEETAAAVGKAAARALVLALAKEVEPLGVHVATVTILGAVAPHTPFDPKNIAETFWTLHSEPSGAWTTEVLYTGRP